jgi:hypothetical protein
MEGDVVSLKEVVRWISNDPHPQIRQSNYPLTICGFIGTSIYMYRENINTPCIFCYCVTK